MSVKKVTMDRLLWHERVHLYSLEKTATLINGFSLEFLYWIISFIYIYIYIYVEKIKGKKDIFQDWFICRRVSTLSGLVDFTIWKKIYTSPDADLQLNQNLSITILFQIKIILMKYYCIKKKDWSRITLENKRIIKHIFLSFYLFYVHSVGFNTFSLSLSISLSLSHPIYIYIYI